MGVRRRGRELALQMLYQHELSSNDIDTIVLSFEELLQAARIEPSPPSVTTGL